MAAAFAGKNTFQEESPTSSTAFLVSIPTSFRCIFVKASPHETIDEVIAGIAVHTRFPAGELRLQDESGHELPGDCPIALCGLDGNTSLRLSYPLLSTKHSGACAAANELVSFIIKLLSTGKIKTPVFLENFTNLFFKFAHMTPTDREEDIVGHLHAFIFSGAHIALGMLWQSPVIFHQHFASYGLHLFLKLNRKKLPESFDFYYLPILLELADEFVRMAGRDNPLYLQCRQTVGELLCSKNWRFSGHSNMKNMVLVFYPFVVDLVEEMIMSLSTENTPPPPIHQLRCFLKQMRREFKNRAAAARAHPFLQTEPAEMEWFLYFYKALKKLKKELFQNLEKIETFIAEKGEGEVKFLLQQRMNILDVLFCFHKLCKMFDPDYGLVRSLIFARRSSLNALIRHADKSHKYYWLLEYKEALDFEVKKGLLIMLFADTDDSGYHDYYLSIDRLNILADSIIQIGQVNPLELHGNLSVVFKDEEGMGNGVMREWFYLLCQEIFSSQMKLFSSCPADRRRFFPNPAPPFDRTQLEHYRFAGRFVALALRHEFQIGVTFDSIFFKQLADKGIDLEDIKDSDPVLYTSCKKLLEMDDEFLDSDALGLTFVRETEELGYRKIIPLCPRGEEIVVNSRNKREFVDFLVESYYVESIDQKIHYFREGFMDLFPNMKFENLFFQSLNLEEFNGMLRGSEEKINIDDWKNHTQYGGYTIEDQQIISFWKIVEGMEEEQRRILLQFWTSIRFLPVGGFCNLPQKLYIVNSLEYEEDDCELISSSWSLPTSQTCFYQLQLPPYPSMSIMHQMLHFITQEHVCCTFGLY